MATAASAAMPPPLPPPPVPPMSNHNHPLTSAGSSSSSASSSGYSSMHDQLLRVAPPSSSSGSSASCSPTGGVSEPPLTLQYNGINNGFRERVIKVRLGPNFFPFPILGSTSPTFYKQLFCMQISKVPEDIDNLTVFLPFWYLVQ